MRKVQRLSLWWGVLLFIMGNGRVFMKSKYRKLHPDEYKVWKGMRARCNAPCNKYRGNYQKLGIKVSKRWDSFDNFFEDMGKRPINHTIERIDSEKDYCKENCRWATRLEQAKNRKGFNRYYTYKGKTLCVKDWAKEFSINYTTLIARLKKMPFEKAIEYDNTLYIEYKGEKFTIKELCSTYNIPISNFYDRRSKGWSVHKILTTPISTNKYKI